MAADEEQPATAAAASPLPAAAEPPATAADEELPEVMSHELSNTMTEAMASMEIDAEKAASGVWEGTRGWPNGCRAAGRLACLATAELRADWTNLHPS